MIQAYTQARIITPFEDIAAGTLLVEGQKIQAVGRQADIEIPPQAKVFDLKGKIICPGFIDIHVHGAKGHDFAEASPSAIREIIDFHMAHGTTAFLPTLISLPDDCLQEVLEKLPEAWSQTRYSSSFLGIHLEGPFLNPAFKGVHDLQALCPPSLEKAKTFFSRSSGTLKMVTLAPDLPGSTDVIKWLNQHQIAVSLGHSEATYDQVKEAVRNGLGHATHTYNAMGGMHHREPGALGAVLDFQDVSTDIIVDGWHVHPMAVRLLWQQKELAKVILITDASPVCGLPEGVYSLWKTEVRLNQGKVSTVSSGRLAGSVTTMDQAMRNLIRITNCSLTEAVQTVTYNPAILLGYENQKGQIRKGCDADLVVMDSNYSVKMVIIDGKIM